VSKGLLLLKDYDYYGPCHTQRKGQPEPGMVWLICFYASTAVNWLKNKINQFTAVIPLVKTLSNVPISFYRKYPFWFGDS